MVTFFSKLKGSRSPGQQRAAGRISIVIILFFQFVELNNDGNIIMDPTVIYKALSDKQNIDIEAYKLKQEVIENFISMLNL